MGSAKSGMTNMCYIHTLTTCRVNLLGAGVAIADNKFFKLACHMICCTRVEVLICVQPIGVHSIGRSVSSTTTTSGIANIVVEAAIKALLAAPRTVPHLLAGLALLLDTVTTAAASLPWRSAWAGVVGGVVVVASPDVVVVVAPGTAATVISTRTAGVAAATTAGGVIGRVVGWERSMLCCYAGFSGE